MITILLYSNKILLLWYKPQISWCPIFNFFFFRFLVSTFKSTQSSTPIFHSLKISCQSLFSFSLECSVLFSAPAASGSNTWTGSFVVPLVCCLYDPILKPSWHLHLWQWGRLNLFPATSSSPDWERHTDSSSCCNCWLCLPQQIPSWRRHCQDVLWCQQWCYRDSFQDQTTVQALTIFLTFLWFFMPQVLVLYKNHVANLINSSKFLSEVSALSVFNPRLTWWQEVMREHAIFCPFQLQ